MHIGVLEDDPDQQAYIEQCLAVEQHRVSLFGRASELRRHMDQQLFDFLIIDWRLPDGCGMDVVGHLRRHDGWKGPILFITASQHEDDVVQALEQGADDFLAKPLRPRELLARINALGRRTWQSPAPAAASIGDAYSMDSDQRQIYLNAEPADLTEREYRLAALLFSKLGATLTRPHLLELVWGLKGDLPTRTVDTHVSRLRRKLELDGRHGLRLKSVYQSGYRLESCSPSD
ncbi:response regulator transcription factor [Halomonas sp. GD1P12]|uniref:response regulator transcription factor n=1 Tax=Halomonas sp. GD1P12 TaxID=2982691 RepID=UPI0021E415D7|nr:response regulator transcription factor [Halomonas sp. GD1P12]UYG00782.1 response regulator transcription factor [Halomonas sp. GD1P12]